MPQQEGETNYKYEDYASELATNRLPQTTALVNQMIKITLDSGTFFDLEFADLNKCIWQSGDDRGTDWCEAVEVAPQTYFIDLATVYKFADNQYIFAFREFGLPVSTVFFYNWDQMRSTGKFFAIADDGAIANTPAGAFITKLSMAFYPLDAQPI